MAGLAVNKTALGATVRLKPRASHVSVYAKLLATSEIAIELKVQRAWNWFKTKDVHTLTIQELWNLMNVTSPLTTYL